ncbi:Profilin/allergen [Metschnikowia bicuspidata]|uniref:Profilin n=1 Tax=Metschnikowia bicuspidata TaxID=27322 RepID=A0A4P9ZK71_9ASCO|nr:Profilin/allergen [Metschnikowia bicuspidata]
MSWTAYTDSLISTGKINKAAIFSAGGHSLWAESGSFSIASKEIKEIAAGFADPSRMQANGLHIEGEKYFLLRADERSIYGKHDDHGIICVSTKQAILIAHYPSGVQAQEATAVVEKLADYLISLNY